MQDIKELLPSYVAGLLSPQESKIIEAELARSPALQTELELCRVERSVTKSYFKSVEALHLSPSQISQYVREELGDAGEKLRIELHLKSCEACTMEISEGRMLLEGHISTEQLLALGKEQLDANTKRKAEKHLLTCADCSIQFETIRDAVEGRESDGDKMPAVEHGFPSRVPIMESIGRLIDRLRVFSSPLRLAYVVPILLLASVSSIYILWLSSRPFANRIELKYTSDEVRSGSSDTLGPPNLRVEVPVLHLTNDVASVDLSVLVVSSGIPSTKYVLALSLPSGPPSMAIHDTLYPSSYNQDRDTLKLTLSKRYFYLGEGRYQLSLKEVLPPSTEGSRAETQAFPFDVVIER